MLHKSKHFQSHRNWKLDLGLGAGESFIADYQQGITADRQPVAGYGYTTFSVNRTYPKFVLTPCPK